MNNTLTAKEWLEEEVGRFDLFTDNINRDELDEEVSIYMKEYSDYRTKKLEEYIAKVAKEYEAKVLELEDKISFIESFLNNDI